MALPTQAVPPVKIGPDLNPAFSNVATLKPAPAVPAPSIANAGALSQTSADTDAGDT
jgi:hypothetical protein